MPAPRTGQPSGIPKRPTPPKFGRGPLRPLHVPELESEATYRHAVLEGESVAGLSLYAVTFEACVFREVDFRGVQWRQVRFQDVQFEHCLLDNAYFEECGLERVQVSGGRMLGCRLSGARLRQVALHRVTAPLSGWDGIDSRGVWWQECDLTEASFLEAKLPGAVFRECKLWKTEFAGAALDGGDLRASDLRGARLGLRELAGVTVEAGQLLDLAHLLGVSVQQLEEDEARPQSSR